ncbi:endonuclease domain-containing protein [Sphingorhabdus sp.]|jgi:very-short-patch-repair endonuclease|uniref:endonuclease domain-containing protein n=1 Tax=Sphingorhabdus sp. TaxID=1902408 RepID=UPI003BB17273|nr:endonuclease domain-containing protein [Sphingomonadales bacterium]MBL0021987.1 endonuclease domain-containing protein [Sphingomonadales bacterium]
MKRLALRPDAITRARRLRRDMTPQERKLWQALRECFPDAHFRKQVPMGPYTADFAWHHAKLIVEVDGGQHGTSAGMAHDANRAAFLEAEGYRILRFWNSDVDQNMEGVLTIIADALPLVGRDGWGPAASAAERLEAHIPAQT